MKLRPVAAVCALAAALVAVAAGSSASGPREILFVGPVEGHGANVLAIRPDGRGLHVVAPDGTNPVWSPRGQRVAYTKLLSAHGEQRPAGGVVAGADGTQPRQIASAAYQALSWSPDGAWIALDRYAGAAAGLYVVHPDGTGLRRLRSSPSGTASWSRNSKRLLIAYKNGLATITLSRVLRPLRNAPCAGDGAYSPNGRWIAFARCLGRPYHTGIAVEHPDGSGLRWLAKPISAAGNWGPAWSPDGKRLAYVEERPVDYLEHTEIRMVSLGGRNLGNLDTSSQAHDEYPEWSPDGRSIVFDRDAAVEPIGEADRLYVGDARTGRVTKIYDNIWRGTQSWRPR